MRALRLDFNNTNNGLQEVEISSELFRGLRDDEVRLGMARQAERAAQKRITFLKELTIKLVKNCGAWGGSIVLCLSDDRVVASYGEMYSSFPFRIKELHKLFTGRPVQFEDFYCHPVMICDHFVGYITLHMQSYSCTGQVRSLVEAYSLLIQKELEPLAAGRPGFEKEDGQYDLFEGEDKGFSFNQLISIATHDLNSLVSAIGGYLKLSDRLLHDTRNLGKVKQYNKQIARGIEGIHDILKQFHDLSRYEQEGRTSDFTRLDISWLVREVGDILQSLAWEKKQDVCLSIPDAPQYAVGDVVMIKRIISNLISNAVKYTQEGGTISVAIQSDTDSVTVSVKDNGIGIPESKLGSIFKPFTRLGKPETGEKSKLSSLGLGLFLSHKFAKIMNGDISVNSKAGEGSEFRLRLPRASHPELKIVNNGVH